MCYTKAFCGMSAMLKHLRHLKLQTIIRLQKLKLKATSSWNDVYFKIIVVNRISYTVAPQMLKKRMKNYAYMGVGSGGGGSGPPGFSYMAQM